MANTTSHAATDPVSRRGFLRLAGAAGAGVAALSILETPVRAADAPAAPPAELTAIPFKDALAHLDGISEKSVREHWKLYQGYVAKVNEIRGALSALPKDSPVNATYSPLRELKVELTFALDGAKNHALYFDHLGGKGGRPTGALLGLIARDFGSFEEWQSDLSRTGLAARGWAWLVYDWDLKRLLNTIGDSQNAFPVWNATPLVALDVYEHAYWLDYQTNRKGYIDAFFANLDWAVIQARAEQFRIV